MALLALQLLSKTIAALEQTGLTKLLSSESVKIGSSYLCLANYFGQLVSTPTQPCTARRAKSIKRRVTIKIVQQEFANSGVLVHRGHLDRVPEINVHISSKSKQRWRLELTRNMQSTRTNQCYPNVCGAARHTLS